MSAQSSMLKFLLYLNANHEVRRKVEELERSLRTAFHQEAKSIAAIAKDAGFDVSGWDTARPARCGRDRAVCLLRLRDIRHRSDREGTRLAPVRVGSVCRRNGVAPAPVLRSAKARVDGRSSRHAPARLRDRPSTPSIFLYENQNR